MSLARIFITSALMVAVTGIQFTAIGAETNLVRTAVDDVSVKRSNGTNDAPVVTAISVHPHEPKCAFVGDDHLVRIYDTDHKKVIHLLDGHTDWVRSVQYDNQGKLIYTSGNDRKILVWRINDQGKYKHQIFANENRAITCIAISRDNKYLATVGFDSKLNVYDIASHRRLFQFKCPCTDMRTISFSPTENILAAGGRSGEIRLWHLDAGKQIRDFKPHRMRIRGLSFSNDGESIVSCSEDRTVAVTKINKVNDPIQKSNLQNYKLMSALAIIDDQRVAIGGTNNLVTIWNIADLERVGKFTGHSGTISALDASKNFLVSGSYDTSIRVWNWNPTVASNPNILNSKLISTK